MPSKRLAAHRRPESILIIVYTVAGEVLLLQRNSPFPFWQSVTGSLDSAETPAEAARRELFEETGLTVEGALADRLLSRTFTIDPRWRNRYAPGVTENIEHEWRYQLTESAQIRIDGTEHDEFRWVSIDEAIDLVWSWTNREALEILQAELHGQQQRV